MIEREFYRRLEEFDGPNGPNAKRMADPRRALDSSVWKIPLTTWQRASGGLGDYAALSGAACWRSQRQKGRLVVPVISGYEADVRSIFINRPEIQVVTGQQGALAGIKECSPLFLQTEIIYTVQSQIDMFRHIYLTNHVPYWERWNSCPIAEAAKKVKQVGVPRGKFAFVHDDPKRNIVLDRRLLPSMRHFRPDIRRGCLLLAYCDALEAATEIHLYDGPFFHLAEALKPRGKMHLHQYAKERCLYDPEKGIEYPFTSIWNDYFCVNNWLYINVVDTPSGRVLIDGKLVSSL
jgi:hypothetical protein